MRQFQNRNQQFNADSEMVMDLRPISGSLITFLALIIIGLGIMGTVQEVCRSPYRLFWKRKVVRFREASMFKWGKKKHKEPVQDAYRDSVPNQRRSEEQRPAAGQNTDSMSKTNPNDAVQELSQEELLRLEEMKNVCLQNLLILGESIMFYSYNHDGHFPPQRGWMTALSSYMEVSDGIDVTHCPLEGRYRYCGKEKYKAGGFKMLIYCTEHKVAFCADGKCRKLKRLPLQ